MKWVSKCPLRFSSINFLCNLKILIFWESKCIENSRNKTEISTLPFRWVIRRTSFFCSLAKALNFFEFHKKSDFKPSSGLFPVFFRPISGETHAFSFSSIFSIDQSSFGCPIKEIWKCKNFTIDNFFWFVNIIFVYCWGCHSQTCLISTFWSGNFIIMFCIWPRDWSSWLETWTLNLKIEFEMEYKNPAPLSRYRLIFRFRTFW